MRYFTVATLAFAAMATVASADPMKLSDGQMDQVSAGVLDNNSLALQIAAAIQASAPITANTVAAVGILSEGVEATGTTSVTSLNSATFNQSSDQSR
jgi:hypothetical protein